MSEDLVKRNAQAEELVAFLSFFREKFDLPDIPVHRIAKKDNKYDFPYLPNFSELSKLLTQEDGLDFYYKSYKTNKTIIKEIQEQKPNDHIKRLLSYLRYMKKQESKKYIYLTRLTKTKNDYINDLTSFIKKLEKSGFDLKQLEYSSNINKNIPNNYEYNEKQVERYVKDISCIIQNINKGIFPGLFTEHDCLQCLKFFTNGKVKYFNEDIYSCPIPILRLVPDRNMSISHALTLNFKAHYLEKIVSKNSDLIAKGIFSTKQTTVGRKRNDGLPLFRAILYKSWTKTKWADVPIVYSDINYMQCKKRKSEWSKDGTFLSICKELRASPKSQDGKHPSDIRKLNELLEDLKKDG